MGKGTLFCSTPAKVKNALLVVKDYLKDFENEPQMLVVFDNKNENGVLVSKTLTVTVGRIG